MIIKLPWIEPIDTLNLPDDFEDKVKESFAKFTEGTSKEYTYQDKLSYLDNLRIAYLRGNIDSEEIIKKIIADRVWYELEENGNMPTADDILSVEFMAECFEAGFMPFLDQYDKRSSSRNERILKVIFKIIQIVVNWSE